MHCIYQSIQTSHKKSIFLVKQTSSISRRETFHLTHSDCLQIKKNPHELPVLWSAFTSHVALFIATSEVENAFWFLMQEVKSFFQYLYPLKTRFKWAFIWLPHSFLRSTSYASFHCRWIKMPKKNCRNQEAASFYSSRVQFTTLGVVDFFASELSYLEETYFCCWAFETTAAALPGICIVVVLRAANEFLFTLICYSLFLLRSGLFFVPFREGFKRAIMHGFASVGVLNSSVPSWFIRWHFFFLGSSSCHQRREGTYEHRSKFNLKWISSYFFWPAWALPSLQPSVVNV